MSNVLTIEDIAGAPEGQSAIGMDLGDWEGAQPRMLKLGVSHVVSNINVVIHSVILGFTVSVGSQESLVNLKLAILLNGKVVGNEWNIQEHVSAKSQRSRGLSVQGSACGASGCVLSDSKGSINQLVCFHLIGRSCIGWGQQNAKHLGNSKMDAFADRVTLWVMH